MVCANAHRYYLCMPVVTMRWNPRQHWLLAQFFECSNGKSLSDGLKPGAFNLCRMTGAIGGAPH
jgi:hypothetical protein